MSFKLDEYLNMKSINNKIADFGRDGPFDHIVIDNFFKDDYAKTIAEAFPSFESEIWHNYDNAIEIKKTCNNWNAFSPVIYDTFVFLNSQVFTEYLSRKIFSDKDLMSDPGLNGGGLHIHTRGGKLNTHLDYSLHPKLRSQRKFNLIIYMNPNWTKDWGGSLGFWSNESPDHPGKLEKSIQCYFNRAVIFDTSQNSWHGLPEPVKCPDNEARKSLAVYYLIDAANDIDKRGKALYAPTAEQADDDNVLELIKKRSQISTAYQVYNKD